MSKIKARFYRWIWLLNPYRLFQGWCGLTEYSCGKCFHIAAVRKTSRGDCYKSFWRVPESELPSVEDIQAIYRQQQGNPDVARNIGRDAGKQKSGK